ncbi:RecQ family ATP-dependent DNA helicase [Enterovibrio paralichthyis]|uniref:RecQ family ATP-dependent DNA helicase n=1 Tax=Enterovibrio paralichthyis TaxID=2853805 RepID=UPI001C492AAB|nr:RecQ family ATP-dependent DNA helicase [Enterovibrio paralichthyis]MBV7298351.1 RecQ family ATP-dependent DNA helicase [Enterovibrio paralichthyis]
MQASTAYLKTLKDVFGFDGLRGGQQSVVENVLAGHSAAAIFPTGSGKSLCYQLPALHLPHLTLVISPLLALMKDQLDFLRGKGIAAASIDSSLTYDESREVMRSVKAGETKILMISVERLKNERFRQFISSVPISLLVVDEAHCISEWGHNFRPDYLKLPAYRTQLNIPQVLLLTATATPQVIDDMRNKFGIASENVEVTGFYRHNLDLNVLPCREEEKDEALLSLIHSVPFPQPTIVYVTLQQTSESVAGKLRAAGVAAQAYHAGMASEDRQRIQNAFMRGEINCIVATIAFGMGVDKSDIRAVIHYDLPKSVENYSQEIGRAGRDGQPSVCSVLANRESVSVLENFVFGDTPDLIAIRAVIDEIGATPAGKPWEVMLTRLSRESNVRQLPLKTLLVYLELAGIIEPQFSYFADYRFKMLVSAEQILNQFDGERRQFVEAIFQCSPKSRTWHSVDFDALWQGFSAERKRAVTALDYFADKGWIALESKQMMDVYRVNRLEACQGEQAQQLSQEMHALFLSKEEAEINRVHAMLSLFETDTCLSHRLAAYFADEHAPAQCGHCSVCRGNIARLPKASAQESVEPAMLQRLIQPLMDAALKEGVAVSAEAATRFLCGIATPLTTRLRAGKMEGFGKLSAYPFDEVKKQVQSLSI